MLLHKTNALAEDIQGKVEKLDTVVHAVQDVGNTIQGLNNSLQKVSTSVSSSMVRNQDKVAQVVQWASVMKEMKDKWFGEKDNKRKKKPLETEVSIHTQQLERGRG